MWLDTRSSRIALGILAGGTILTLAVRILTSSPYLVLGDDTGSYLATLNAVQGKDASGFAGLRPPLIGYFLWPFVEIFGQFTGAKLAALVASVSGAGAFYLVAKRMASPLMAALGGIAFMWLPIYAETLGWGFLSILVLSVALLALWAWIRYGEAPSLDRAITAGAISAVIAYLNQTAMPVVAVLFGGFVIYLLCKDFRLHAKFLLPAGALTIVLGLGSIPYSFAHFDNLSGDMESTRGIFSLALKGPVAIAVAALGTGFFVYSAKKIGGMIGILILIGGVSTSIAQALTVPASLGLITVLGRTILWFWMFAALVGVWALPRVFTRMTRGLTQKQLRPFAFTAVAVGLLFLTVSWQLRLESVMPIYTTLTPDSVKALQWVEANTAPGEKVGAYPLTMAFYTNGVANRPTITTAPDGGESGELSYKEAVRGWWLRDDRAVRCSLGYLPECTTYLPDLGARYLLTRAEADLPVAYRSGDVTVYRTVTP